MVKGNKYAEKIGVSRPGKCRAGGVGEMGQTGISKGGNSKGEEKVKEEIQIFGPYVHTRVVLRPAKRYA